MDVIQFVLLLVFIIQIIILFLLSIDVEANLDDDDLGDLKLNKPPLLKRTR